MIISIDGPAASGKSTMARLLAKELCFYYVSTGLLYRALAYILSTHYGYSVATIGAPRQEDVAEALAKNNLSYFYKPETGAQLVFKGVDITQHLKTGVMDELSSRVSTNQYVRDSLLKFQREFSRKHDIVMEGRD
ncbi:(d)CMP kinase, partial [Candidatus Babeliales bacterium]|nr:(d)CMP kinase [Candidatus Babeliales bacterium]